MARSPIRTRFGFASTAGDVAQGIDLSGKCAVVTGGASGIGVETARALASAGAEVTLGVRDIGAGKRVAADLARDPRSAAVHVACLDLTDRASIEQFVSHWRGPLHVLVTTLGS